jgi:hypothetical protein
MGSIFSILVAAQKKLGIPIGYVRVIYPTYMYNIKDKNITNTLSHFHQRCHFVTNLSSWLISHFEYLLRLAYVANIFYNCLGCCSLYFCEAQGTFCTVVVAVTVCSNWVVFRVLYLLPYMFYILCFFLEQLNNLLIVSLCWWIACIHIWSLYCQHCEVQWGAAGFQLVVSTGHSDRWMDGWINGWTGDRQTDR